MDRIELEKIAAILRDLDVTIFEYFPAEDRLCIYDRELRRTAEWPHCLKQLKNDPHVHPEDRWKILEFFKGKARGPVEVRVTDEEDRPRRKRLRLIPFGETDAGRNYVGTIGDVTREYEQLALLEGKALRDSLTGLYNHDAGKSLINEYLNHKNPYESCAMMLLDVDYFKSVNDNYGHLFGDEVLTGLARALTVLFDEKDILIRAGGDEFVVLLKEIGHVALLKRAETLLRSIRELRFSRPDYSLTCSVGVCYLPENVSGYTYDQLFSNADWALYQAKEQGRNCYAFCDTLQRFEKLDRMESSYPDLEPRYLHNDVVATAFEIFEKQSNFVAAIELLLKVIGVRFQLDRITVIRTDVKENQTSRQYMWTAPDAPSVLEVPASFTKEDFLTLFHSYDEYGTTVLNWDDMAMYSEGARALLMQGGAKTVVYAAMYLEGSYTGAISYVVCGNKRFWSRLQRSQLGELTKIISAHLARVQALNARRQSCVLYQELDPLTGLLSFASFREEVERLILGNYTDSHLIVHTDFYNFHAFNQKYGYQAGDQLLKDFSSCVAEHLQEKSEIYATRVPSDHFILFMRYHGRERALQEIEKINRDFLQRQREKYPDHQLKLRSGVFFLDGENVNTAEAIDYAGYAREQGGSFAQEVYVGVFNEEMRQKRKEEAGLTEGFEEALKKGEFQVYLQPRFSLNDLSLTGAEAVIRWKKDADTLLYPRDFLELYEKSGRIIELDFFVFEQAAALLARLKKEGRPLLPLSVNASARHAQNSDTAKKYRQILEKYQIDPAWLEIEFTETDRQLYSAQVRAMMEELQKIRLTITLDDYGSGYSRLDGMLDAPVNTVKLDRSLLNACAASEKGTRYLAQIVKSVKGLGYRAICAGVETAAQAELVKRLGCDEAQGYWFAHPMPIEEFESRLTRPGAEYAGEVWR